MHPILFHIGDFYIGTYGVMIVIGVGAAILLGLHYAKKVGVPPEFIYDLAFVVLLAGFIGGRVLFIVVGFKEFLADPLSMILSRTGFVFVGGLLFAMAAAIGYIRYKRMPIWEVADIAGPSLPMAHAFGRIGCFLAGCCYGSVCPADFPLGASFPHLIDRHGETVFSFAYGDQLQRGLIDASAAASLPVYPTQLFESAANFIISLALIYMWRKRKFPGQIFVLYLMLYGFARFCIEFFRGDAERGIWIYGLSTSQIFCLVAIAGAAVLWTKLKPRMPIRGARPAHGK